MKGFVMEKTRSKFTMAVIVLGAVLGAQVQAAGLMKPVSGNDSEVFIKSHKVSVLINNGFARTEVDQVFGNKSGRDLEAIYSFPIPKQASLSELSLWINGVEVVGEVLEKEQAKQTYQQQKQKGNETAVAEKNDFKTFDISVSPVLANADTRVRLVYYQPLEIDLNVGRYVYPLAEGGVDEERISFWTVDDAVQEKFSFDLTLKSAFPVKEVRTPGYTDQSQISKQPADESASGEVHRVHIESGEGGGRLSDDIVVYYRLADDVPARVELIPYKPSAESTGTFMVVVTPAADLKPIAEGVDWTFVLDVSGSMQGPKIATLADGVSRVLGKLNPNDRFRIITFNQNAQELTQGYIVASADNVQNSINQVKSIQANGSTNLFEGLEMAYRSLDSERSTGVVVVTDGVTNTGQTEHTAFVKLLRQYDIRLFTFVIGNSANQPLLDMLAKESNGFAMNISDRDDIYGRLVQAKAKILYENLHDVQLQISGGKVSDLTPSKPGNLYQGQQLVMFGHYKGSGPVKIEMNAKISGQEQTWTCQADLPAMDTDNPELERLWALSSIDEIAEQIRLGGEKDSLRKNIVALGTEYSLVTDYTSMLVLKEEEYENAGIQRNNANRVQNERAAQQQRNAQPVKNYRVDTNPQSDGSNTPTFDNRPSPGIGTGSGPVGPLFVGLMLWLKRRSNLKQ